MSDKCLSAYRLTPEKWPLLVDSEDPHIRKVLLSRAFRDALEEIIREAQVQIEKEVRGHNPKRKRSHTQKAIKAISHIMALKAPFSATFLDQLHSEHELLQRRLEELPADNVQKRGKRAAGASWLTEQVLQCFDNFHLPVDEPGEGTRLLKKVLIFAMGEAGVPGRYKPHEVEKFQEAVFHLNPEASEEEQDVVLKKLRGILTEFNSRCGNGLASTGDAIVWWQSPPKHEALARLIVQVRQLRQRWPNDKRVEKWYDLIPEIDYRQRARHQIRTALQHRTV